MINHDAIPARNSSVIGQELQGEAVLLLPMTGEIKVLNDVGARIWDLIDGQRRVGQIAAMIHAEYQVAEAEAREEVLAFFAELLKRDMISIVPT